MSTKSKPETLHDCPKCGRKNFTAKGLKAHVCKGAIVLAPPQKLAVITDEVPLHNLYHRNAMLSTAMAACWFVLAGAELARKKKAAGHGKWEQWVAGNCEYSIDTAQRYMAVAERVKDKALKASAKDGGSKTAPVRFLELLEKPASALTPEEQMTLLKSVHGLTDGATISELYEDFGIVKKLKDRGGPREKKDKDAEPSAEEKMETFLNACREDFTTAFVSGVDALALNSRWKSPTITDGEREDAIACMEKLIKKMKAWLKLPQKQRSRPSLADAEPEEAEAQD